MQEDTYQDDGLNLYAYCKNNSVVYYDPSGYSQEPKCVEAGFGEDDGGNEGSTGTRGDNNLKLSNIADDISQRAENGNLKRGINYHGRLGQGLEQQIIANPDAVYVTNNNKQNLVYRKGDNVVIVESRGSSKGNIITSYGPDGPRGKSGAAIFGGSPSDPGMPVTHEDILNGIKQPGGGTFPPATQIR